MEFRKIGGGGAEKEVLFHEKEVLFHEKEVLFHEKEVLFHEKNLKIFSLYTMRMCEPLSPLSRGKST